MADLLGLTSGGRSAALFDDARETFGEETTHVPRERPVAEEHAQAEDRNLHLQTSDEGPRRM